VGARILVIDDEKSITNFLRRGLSYEGFSVDVAHDGLEGLQIARDTWPDVVVLDIMLPGMDGLEVCRRLRAGGDVPILMLTAKDEVADRVAGLENGADDYLVKPFAFEELLARIRALLRRREAQAPAILHFNDLVLDTSSRQVARGSRSIDLSTKEYELLALFLRHPRQVVTRESIFESVWGYDFSGESNVLDVYVGYLRSKLEAAGEARLIHTVRGVGYILRE
jgi:two-component system response regulator MprA